jgi:ubiquinone/menaquinone biosynthesis C-methylase UbiE
MTAECLEKYVPTAPAKGREWQGDPATNGCPEEFYSISDAESQRIYVGGRRASQWVGFLLPHLRRGMTVLDCGCGVGSITLDLAEIVAPGPVVGIDRDEGQLAVARQAAIDRGLSNVTFRQGSIHAIPFPEGSFDVVLAHTLLFHLRSPLDALAAIRRALRPGGIAAVSDDDYRTVTYSPDDPMMQRIIDLWTRVVEHNGGNPFYSRHLRSLLLQAGFPRTEGFAVAADHYGTREETRRFARIMTGLLRGRALVTLVGRQCWATRAELDEMADWLRRWGERPDAFFSVTYCAALGWAA